MRRAEKLSSDADNFPDDEVEYEDLLGMPYGSDRRVSDGRTDCLGVVLEIYRRAGLGLPDPARAGTAILDFQEMFEEVSSAETLYDLVDLRAVQHHLFVLVRPRVVLSAKQRIGVYAAAIKPLLGRADATFWRLRDAALPE